ncbi:MAG: putative endonuclease [Bacteroidia bacterium]|jgi:putative endonuclease
MSTVYCLYSKENNKIYIGYTSDLLDRFHSHNELATKGYTVRYRPWIVAYVEFFDTKKEAINREKQLKSFQGRCYLQKHITELINKNLL